MKLLVKEVFIPIITSFCLIRKSTFYGIISGCRLNQRYTAKALIDHHIELPDAFHNIEFSRTVVL